jgi:hypothetical protein
MRKLKLLVAIFLSAMAFTTDAQTFGSQTYPWRTMGFDSTYVPGQILVKDLIAAPRGKFGLKRTDNCASAALQVNDTAKGALLPRVTTTQMNAIASPCNGLLVYNTTDTAFYYYKQNAWTKIGVASGGGSLQDLQSVLDEGNIAESVTIQLDDSDDTLRTILGAADLYLEDASSDARLNYSGITFQTNGDKVGSVLTPSLLEFNDESNPEYTSSFHLDVNYLQFSDTASYTLLKPANPKAGSVVYRLPDTTGTIALLSDIQSSSGSLDLQAVTDNGSTTTNEIFIPSLNIWDNPNGQYVNIVAEDGWLSLNGLAGKKAVFDYYSIDDSSQVIYTLPNESGTLALTSQIPVFDSTGMVFTTIVHLDSSQLNDDTDSLRVQLLPSFGAGKLIQPLSITAYYKTFNGISYECNAAIYVYYDGYNVANSSDEPLKGCVFKAENLLAFQQTVNSLLPLQQYSPTDLSAAYNGVGQGMYAWFQNGCHLTDADQLKFIITYKIINL